MTLAPGSRLGPYEITGPLGAGGMGEVYRARDSRLDRDVAIKVLPENVSTSPAAMERFGREAKAIAALSHPGILSIHDYGKEGRTAYAVTELLEGETLEQRLSQGALTPRKAVEFAVQIANALASAHERGVIHRDLKPANLFITTDGRVKILDFGLARWQEASSEDGSAPEAKTQTRHTASGVILGTAGYMSPEQVRAQPVDHRSDIFALGCVLYEMVAGRRAFQRETSAEAMTAVLREDPPDLASLGRPAPAGLERLIRRCLEKRPDDRLQSARDLGIALDAVSVSDSAAGTAAPIGPRAPRLSPSLVAAALAVLSLAAAAYWVGLRAGRPAPPNLPAFTKLTFRRGVVSAARFAGDGRSVVYSASWDSAPLRIYTTDPASPRAGTAELHEAHLFAVSRSNELAVALKPAVGLLYQAGTLARAPLGGAGAPRAVLEDVQQAEWSKDGDLAVVRTSLGRARLEFPIGQVRYESSGWLSAPRLSPKGDALAFLEHPIGGDDRGWPALVDLKSGAKRDLSKEFAATSGLAWRPDGSEVCLGAGSAIQCIGVEGGESRRVFQGMHRLVVEDISPDGKILATAMGLQGAARSGTIGGAEADLGDTPASVPADIDPRDGRVLFASIDYGIHLETKDHGPPIRLGDGIPMGLSPDGTRVLTLVPGVPTQLTLIPTGAGAAGVLERGPIERHAAAVFMPDGKGVVMQGAEKGRGSRLYTQDLAGGPPRPISAEGVSLPPGQPRLVSADGAFVAAIGPDQKLALYPLGGGEPRPIPGVDETVWPLGWTDRPGVLFVSPLALARRVPVARLDVRSGKREAWKEFGPLDPIGSPLTLRLQFTPDGNRYAYLYFLSTSELVLIENVFGKSGQP